MKAINQVVLLLIQLAWDGKEDILFKYGRNRNCQGIRLVHQFIYACFASSLNILYSNNSTDAGQGMNELESINLAIQYIQIYISISRTDAFDLIKYRTSSRYCRKMIRQKNQQGFLQTISSYFLSHRC